MSRMKRWADRRAEIKKESERVKAIVEHHDEIVKSIDELFERMKENDRTDNELKVVQPAGAI